MINKLKEGFITPQNDYSPIPFWFWNDNLEEGEIERQIHDFKSKGVMGFVIHPRIGIPKEIVYLSDRFMELVKFAVEAAASLDMKVVLYDEAMYPSGSAHGMVVKNNPEYASRGLKMIEYPVSGNGCIKVELEYGEGIVSTLMVEKVSDKEVNENNIKKLSFNETTVKYSIPFDEKYSILVFIETYSEGTIRGIHFGEDDREGNAPPSGDLLNNKAMEKFIKITHDRYYDVLKKYFGNTVIAMFTDEPGILGRAGKRGLKPWTGNFLDWYLDCGNKEEDLALIWYEGGEKTEEIRKNYRKAVNKKLEETYYKPISKWCEEHGIALTGHPEKSDEIGFLKYFHIPGQDVVWRWIAPEDNKGVIGEHSTMGKCSSDAARHMGRRRNSNECFGCCGPNGVHWGFSAEDMKWYFDWLFVRGVNLVYPHAFFYSIDGPGRSGERPPDVGPNNIWWKHYNKFSDYIKRMCYIMTDSYNTTSVAVLCEEDHLPWKIVKPLYENQIEFNYLENNLLSGDSAVIEEGNIFISKQRYSVIVIEDVGTLTEAVDKKLNSFIANGGNVIIYNPKNKQHNLEGAFEIKEIEDIISNLRSVITNEISIVPHNNNLRISHIVKDKAHFYCLVNEGESEINGEVYIGTVGDVEKWDPWKGTIGNAEVKELREEGVIVPINLNFRESLILCVDEKRNPSMLEPEKVHETKEYILRDIKAWTITNLPNSIKDYTLFDSWTTWEGMEDFSGTITYSTCFNIEEDDYKSRVMLELGELYEICELYVNGVQAGVSLWPPYIFDITDYVKAGENHIDIAVTNTLANKIEKACMKSGLLGPVKVIYKKCK